METYPVRDRSGRMIGFEIENVYVVNPKTVSKLLSTVEGVSDIRNRRLFDLGNEIHVTFDYFGEKCIVWEPWGDSNRYWIGPEEEGSLDRMDVTRLQAVFDRYEPPLLIRLLGDFLTLRYFKR